MPLNTVPHCINMTNMLTGEIEMRLERSREVLDLIGSTMRHMHILPLHYLGDAFIIHIPFPKKLSPVEKKFHGWLSNMV